MTNVKTTKEHLIKLKDNYKKLEEYTIKSKVLRQKIYNYHIGKEKESLMQIKKQIRNIEKAFVANDSKSNLEDDDDFSSTICLTSKKAR